jgi:hypothetical protein
VDSRAGDLALADEPEAIDVLRRELRALVAGDPLARLDAWQDLMPRFSEGRVAYAAAVPLLVDLAESLEDPARSAALALLVALGHDAVEGTASRSELDAAFAAVAPRLDPLAGRFRLSARLAQRIVRRARGDRYALAEVEADLERVERLLTDGATEHARRQDARSRTPEALVAAARAAVIHDASTAADAITLAHRCLNAGLPEEVLLVCSKLGEWSLRAEPARIRALVTIGRVDEAREATTELTDAWLAPATSARSANQVLLKDEMRELLRDVRTVMGDERLADLARAVERAEVEVFIDPSSETF